MFKISFQQFFYKWMAALLVLAFAIGAAGVPVARAADLTVTNLDDSGTGSLRQAIDDANANPGADTITFDVSGTITLASTLTAISDAAGLTIDGSRQSITISGNSAVQLMRVNSGAVLTVRNLTIANGQSALFGGGIENSGMLTAMNILFIGNSARADGGGIYNFGTLDIKNSTFIGNIARSDGGALYNEDGTIRISDTTFIGNQALGFSGGAIGSDTGTLTISNSVFRDNTAPLAGGAIDRVGGNGNLTITNSTFSGNAAMSPFGSGGAIYVYTSGIVSIQNSTFINNATGGRGGGIRAGDTVILTNNTFIANSAREGGAFYSNRTSTVSNNTFSSNSATEGGGIYDSACGDPCGGSLTLTNNIIANSSSGGNCFTREVAANDGGGNLVWGDTTCPGINADPMLGALQNNGGLTETMALLDGSPAIDAAIEANCPTTDQRGYGRNGTCDIGSYEFNGTPPSLVDSTSPVITLTTPAEAAVYLLGQSVNADYVCEDETDGSGLASCVGTAANGSPIDTSSVGAKSFTVNATDNADNTTSVTHNYSVVYNFGGFSQPVDSFPMVNSVKAGAGVPVKFSLGGYQGLNIITAGYPKIEFAACTGSSVDAVETTVTAGNSSLSYDESTGQYTYIWKTDKAWANRCGTLQMSFIDGTTHTILFKFNR